MDDELLTVTQVAQEWETSTAVIRARIKEGELPTTRYGRLILIRRSDVVAACNRLTEQYNARLAAQRAKWDAEIAEKEARALERRIEREARHEVAGQVRAQHAHIYTPSNPRPPLHPSVIAVLKGLEWQARREEVIARDGLICQLCHQAVRADDVDIDHIIPRSQGGSDDLDNLRVTHSFCNRSRGAARANYTPITYFNPILLNPERRKLGRKKKEQTLWTS